MNKYGIDRLPSDVLQETASRAKRLRKEAGYSQVELARRSGVSLGSVKRFENTGQISMISFLKILYLLGRLNEFDDLLERGEDMRELGKLFTNK